jgi:FKBP-type peptidyl-prolyl cis-trans isomerase
MKKIFLIFICVYANLFLLNAQNFLTTKNGLKYRYITPKTNTKTAQIDDLLDFSVTLKNYKDSLIFTRDLKQEPLKKQSGKGDVSEILQYMSVGDSVYCQVPVDSLVKFTGQPAPVFMPAGTMVHYYFKMKGIKSMAEMKANEAKIIQQYALQNGLKLTATPSGFQYIITQKNPLGEPAKVGQRVKMNYSGFLLDGKLFDSNNKEIAQKNNKFQEGRPYEAFEFTLGKGQVIQGWDEGVALLKTGEKATFLIPSYLAYGKRAVGNDIPANSILRFDVELLEVINETKIINEYAKKNNLKTSSTASGLQYVITQKNPTGTQAASGKKVKVHYTGQLLNGKIFDTSVEEIAKKNNKFQEGRAYQPINFTLGQKQVIQGWDEGIALLKVGEKATFLIPSELAYGKRGAGEDIPANSILRFDVELVAVE